jgi:uncharacterized protein with NRDE domain
MCLILLAWRVREDLPFIVAANRDEFHSRPASSAAFWTDRPAILAGRDLQAQGTWMGVSRAGKFAAVTNYRGAREPSAAESRGALVTRYLENGEAPGHYMENVARRAQAYSGFNLLAADDAELWWMSNRGGEPRRLEPGIYGLGNALLDSPEVEPAKERFRQALEPASVDALFTMLAEAKILNPQYGTRCSTVLLRRREGQVRYAERSYVLDGSEQDTVQFEFEAKTKQPGAD